MTNLDLFNPQTAAERRVTARKLRDAGMKRAMDHADRVSDSWSERAYDRLNWFLATIDRGTVFTCEQVRSFAERFSLPKPPDNRAWGAVMVKGTKAGICYSDGYVPAEDPKAHRGPVTKWVKGVRP